MIIQMFWFKCYFISSQILKFDINNVFIGIILMFIVILMQQCCMLTIYYSPRYLV